ncbi:MAG: hypothetical protein CUN55_14765, partial [Phototrophicales bacterium]
MRLAAWIVVYILGARHDAMARAPSSNQLLRFYDAVMAKDELPKRYIISAQVKRSFQDGVEKLIETTVEKQLKIRMETARMSGQIVDESTERKAILAQVAAAVTNATYMEWREYFEYGNAYRFDEKRVGDHWERGAPEVVHNPDVTRIWYFSPNENGFRYLTVNHMTENAEGRDKYTGEPQSEFAPVIEVDRRLKTLVVLLMGKVEQLKSGRRTAGLNLVEVNSESVRRLAAGHLVYGHGVWVRDGVVLGIPVDQFYIGKSEDFDGDVGWKVCLNKTNYSHFVETKFSDIEGSGFIVRVPVVNENGDPVTASITRFSKRMATETHLFEGIAVERDPNLDRVFNPLIPPNYT